MNQQPKLHSLKWPFSPRKIDRSLKRPVAEGGGKDLELYADAIGKSADIAEPFSPTVSPESNYQPALRQLLMDIPQGKNLARWVKWYSIMLGRQAAIPILK